MRELQGAETLMRERNKSEAVRAPGCGVSELCAKVVLYGKRNAVQRAEGGARGKALRSSTGSRIRYVLVYFAETSVQ